MRNSYDPEYQPEGARSNPGNRSSRTIILLLIFLAVLAAVLAFILISGKKKDSSSPDGSAAISTSSAQTQTDTPSDSPISTETPDTTPGSSASSETDVPSPVQDDSWKLILVNADHPLPEDFTVTLKELRYGHHVDERIYPELQQMFDDARAAGIFPLINESFRTRDRQQEIMDKYIAGYEAEGMSHEEAVNKAHQIVAIPGTSEHELGLALDIIAEYDSDSSATWSWLKDNCWRYGFILRYPADKVDITGISFEPWHFRYVGTQAAKEIMEQGLCLEEYIDLINES